MPDGMPHGLIDPTCLIDRVWRLNGDPAARPHAQLILLPSGRIGAGWGTGLMRWELAGGSLRLLDANGAPRVAFASAESSGTLLHGRAFPAGDSCQLAHLRALPPPVDADVPPASVSLRRNLVILRAGPESLHAAWLHDCPPEVRNWDLWLCTYGAGTPYTPAERRIHLPGSKFEGLAALLAAEPFWLAYEYVWFPDDDLLAEWQGINRLFELCRSYGLALAQPALRAGSFANHRITLAAKDSLLRFTSFVEIMAPVFSRAALCRAAPTFGLNPSGYGLDHLWPAIIDAPPTAIAIIDAVAVLHTRPIGASYDQQRAMRDGWTLEDGFHEVNRYEVGGSLAANPTGYVKRHGAIVARN